MFMSTHLARHGLAAIIVILILSASASFAQELKPLYVPSEDGLALEAYAKRSQAITQKFDEDAYLSFSVDLPQNWTARPLISLKNFSRSNRLHGDLARFEGVAYGDMRSHFRVRSVELPREISAKNWLITYLLEKGYTLYSLNTAEDGRSFDAMYIVFSGDKGESQIVRSRAYVSGPRIVLGEYVMPRGLWERERDQQAYAVGSFEIKAEDQQWIEPREYFSYLEAIEFEYPDSWGIVNKDDGALNVLHVNLGNMDMTRVSEGEIALSVASNRSIKDFTSQEDFEIDLMGLVKKLQESILAKGYTLDSKMGNRTLDLDHDFKVQRTEIYPLRPILTEYEKGEKPPITHELWLSILVEPGRAVVSTLLTPARGEDLYSWAVNSRAYEQILKTVQ